jgi:DNA-directed RNA polymerase specialized sigma24 family protein
LGWGIELKRRAGVRAETEENLVFLLDERIRRVSNEVLEQQLAQERGATDLLVIDQEARRLQQTLQRIMSKEFISAKEAAVLLNCSERHIHSLVDRARRQIDDNPIPFRKIGEIKTFLRTLMSEVAQLIILKDNS